MSLDPLDHPEGSTAPAKRVVMVAAVARNGVIGLDGDIPWSIPEDLKHFRATTKGHTVLMGRSTYESIGHPLPYRTNVVITRQPDWSADGVLVAHSVEEGLELARGLEGDVMVIGGGEIYREAMPHATHQVLTEVDLEPDGSGTVLVHGHGDFRKLTLAPNEECRVSTGNLAAFSSGVDYDVEAVGSLRKTFFGKEGLFMTRLCGPGSVLLQTLKPTRAGRGGNGAG